MLKRASDNQTLSDPRDHPVGPEPTGLAGGLDVRELLRIARRRGPMVVVLGLLAALAGAIYALQLTPSYTARATLLLDAKGNNIVNAEAVVQGFSGNEASIRSEMELIRSYDVAKRVVSKLKLDEEVQNVTPSSPSLLRQAINLLTARASVPQPQIGSDPVDVTDNVIRSVQRGVGVDRREWSYVIDITYASPNPAKAAQIANAFANEYLVDQLESRYEATRRANEWLNLRLGDLRQKVRDSERAVELFKAQNNIVETAGSTLSDQQIGKLNEQLILARAEAAQAQVKYDQIQAVRKRGGDVTAFADAMQSGALASLKAKASEVRRELANLTARYGNRHPSVVSARAQLADVNRSIGTEARRVVATAENELRVARSRVQSIESSLNEMKGTVATVSQAEITLRELEREALANKTLYENFLNRFKETSEQEKLQTTEARIIQEASVPTSPTAPNKKMITVAALALGLALGAALAFLLEQLDSGYRTSTQIERTLRVPVLASVPRADSEVVSGFGRVARSLNPLRLLAGLFAKGDNAARRMSRVNRVAMSRVVISKPLSTFTEAIRALRMGIKFADVDRPQKIILVTSALPGEGKSTIASNLAQLAATSGERVLLMDLDLRHPVTTSFYAPDAKIGSVELLLGEADLKQVIVKDQSSGLHVIPSPSRRDLTHTAELLGSKRLKDLLSHLSDYYDLIVVDTSPLLPVTDGRALIDAVDSLALVVQWEKTARDAVETALKQSLGATEKLTGIVLNDVVASKARYYDYYKSGYYNKKYPYYYGGKA
jgi:succinoglycan biosynthesis transport protein ExoP